MNKITQVFILTFTVLLTACNSGNTKSESDQSDSATFVNPLAELNSEILHDKGNDRLYINRAAYYLSVNKTDSALRDILIALDIDSLNTDHYITLSDAYLLLGNPDKCLEALDFSLKLKPNNQEAMLKKAQLFLIMRDYDKTYAAISELIALDRINPKAYFIRAMALIEEADTANAIKNLHIAIDQNQDFFDAQLQLGILYARRNNPLAISYLQNAINLVPQTIEPYYQLGLFFQENGRTASAIQTYNSILDIESEYVPALYNLGFILLVYEQDFEGAAEYFAQVIQLAPEYGEAWYNRGYCYELSGQREFARNDYKKTLKLLNNYPKAIEGLNRLDER